MLCRRLCLQPKGRLSVKGIFSETHYRHLEVCIDARPRHADAYIVFWVHLLDAVSHCRLGIDDVSNAPGNVEPNTPLKLV